MDRLKYHQLINQSFKLHKVCALLGARQVGKSTLARDYIKKKKMKNVNFFDLEDPTDLARLENPKLAFEGLSGLVVIDEIQRRPDLFPIIRVIADKKKLSFMILGSASRDLLKQSSESLAGRISYIEVRPFSVIEKIDFQRLWLKGGFPRAYLANDNIQTNLWLKNYISNFLERDIPNLGFNIPPQTMRKFWLMLSHYHGAILNASEIGSSLGISSQSIRRYLDILINTFMVRELQPWHVNIDKRQIKRPKIYIRDSGVLHYLLGLNPSSSILTHPKLGASWEGFALEQLTTYLDLAPEEIFFWGTHAEAELDLYTVISGKKIGFEFKYTDSPKISKSMKHAINDLKLNHLYLIYPGPQSFKLREDISVISLKELRKFSP